MPDSQSGHRDSSQPGGFRFVWRGWLVVFLLAFLLYATTANRGAQWQDSGGHILQIVNGELLNPRGLALTHPLHHWLGRLVVSANLFEPCFAITLISALAAAVAVANVFGVVWTLTRSREAALLAAVSLALAHTFWQLATRTETYTLGAALFTGECWCLAAYAVRRKTICLWGMLLLNGLGVGNHMQAMLTTPVVMFVVLHGVSIRRVSIKDACIAALAWVVGSLPYTGLVASQMLRSGDVIGTLRSALFGQSFANQVMNVALPARLLLLSAGFVVMNFPNLLLPAAVHGVMRGAAIGVPTIARRALLAGLIIHVCFVFRYSVIDHHTFFLPVYVLLALFGGIGFAAIMRWERVRLRRAVVGIAVGLLALTPVLYGLAPTVARRLDVLGSVARNKPYRDDYIYVFTPWTVVEQSAETMSRHAVELAGEHALIIVEDPMAEFAVRYRILRDDKADLTIVRGVEAADISAALEAGKAIVLVPFNADSPRTRSTIGAWKRIGDLYVLDGEASKP